MLCTHTLVPPLYIFVFLLRSPSVIKEFPQDYIISCRLFIFYDTVPVILHHTVSPGIEQTHPSFRDFLIVMVCRSLLCSSFPRPTSHLRPRMPEECLSFLTGMNLMETSSKSIFFFFGLESSLNRCIFSEHLQSGFWGMKQQMFFRLSRWCASFCSKARFFLWLFFTAVGFIHHRNDIQLKWVGKRF